MSLFYRRSIQEMLSHCSYFLSKEQLETLVKNLNLENEKSLHAQWELAVLYALSASGLMEHEPDYKRKPDIRWTSRNSLHEFIADVRTVSDEGYEKENPREFYRRELYRQTKKAGLDPSFFRDEPGHAMEGNNFRDRKVKLLYPPVNEYKRLFNADFFNFIQRIKNNQPGYDEIRLQGGNFDVKVIYQVQQGSIRIGGGNISYTVPYSATRNPVFHALKDKANQLKRAEYQGVKGVILTDGGCQMLNNGFRSPTGETYTDEDIILRFLKGRKSISFVMTIFTKRENHLYSQLEPLRIRAKLFANPDADFLLPNTCKNALMEMPRFIPEPKLNGDNAARHLKQGWDGPEKGWYGGTKITSGSFMNKIYISSRSLAELLSQQISLEKFCEINNLNGDQGNILNLWLNQGLGISNVAFERHENQDDDHVVLTYEPDFSLKKYEMPKHGLRRLIYNLWQKLNYFRPKQK